MSLCKVHFVWGRFRRAFALSTFTFVLGLSVQGWALGPKSAQPPKPKTSDESAQADDAIIAKVGITQRLGETLPSDLAFTNSKGEPVVLGDLLGTRPAVLALVYYECPMLCTMVLNGLMKTLNALQFDAGKEFDIITVSIDPRETPELAAQKKKQYLDRYRRPTAEEGWHFLVGNASSVEALAEAVGFSYAYDPETDQFAHGSSIMVVTPEAAISRYFYGIKYSPVDLRLSLVEASKEKIGSFTDAILLTCFQYDPLSATYSLAIMRVVRIVGILTVLGLAAFVGVSLLREQRAVPEQGETR